MKKFMHIFPVKFPIVFAAKTGTNPEAGPVGGRREQGFSLQWPPQKIYMDFFSEDFCGFSFFSRDASSGGPRPKTTLILFDVCSPSRTRVQPGSSPGPKSNAIYYIFCTLGPTRVQPGSSLGPARVPKVIRFTILFVARVHTPRLAYIIIKGCGVGA